MVCWYFLKCLTGNFFFLSFWEIFLFLFKHVRLYTQRLVNGSLTTDRKHGRKTQMSDYRMIESHATSTVCKQQTPHELIYGVLSWPYNIHFYHSFHYLSIFLAVCTMIYCSLISQFFSSLSIRCSVTFGISLEYDLGKTVCVKTI